MTLILVQIECQSYGASYILNAVTGLSRT